MQKFFIIFLLVVIRLQSVNCNFKLSFTPGLNYCIKTKALDLE